MVLKQAGQIRGIPALPEVKIIAVSASVRETTRQRVRNAEFNAFITKPVRIKKLLKAIEAVSGVEWKYGQPSSPQSKQKAEPELIPPQPEIRKLLEFANKGLVLDIRRALEDLEQRTPELKPFVDTVRQFNQEFDCGRNPRIS